MIATGECVGEMAELDFQASSAAIMSLCMLCMSSWNRRHSHVAGRFRRNRASRHHPRSPLGNRRCGKFDPILASEIAVDEDDRWNRRLSPFSPAQLDLEAPPCHAAYFQAAVGERGGGRRPATPRPRRPDHAIGAERRMCRPFPWSRSHHVG